MESPKNNDIRCSVCLREYNLYDQQQLGTIGCPDCRSIIPPLFLIHDIHVRVNWQDLRILATYSKRWVTQFDMTLKGNQDMVKALENILQKLQQYQPARTVPIVIQDETKVDKKTIPLRSPYFGSPEDGGISGKKF